MHWKPRGWTLVGILLLAIPGVVKIMTMPANAQVSQIATTQVTDTVYLADGTTATGSVIVSWQAFTTAIGQVVPAGTTSATIGAGGALSLQLAPDAGATPMGTYYTAVYHLDDGTVSREFWVVPVSQTPVQVSAIKSTVLPTSVAMQTVSKSYVDTAIATAISGHPLDGSSPYVLITGSAMTGPLVLPGDPATARQAADKNYVDENITALNAGVGQKVSLLPTASQQVVQPVGTELQVNNLNGDEYASQYATGQSNNGIANAMASPDCAAGCNVKVERNYPSVEGYTASTWNSGSGGTHLQDNRDGQQLDIYMNPASPRGNGVDAGQVIDVTSTRSTAAEVAEEVTADPNSYALVIRHEALTGGSNLFPQSIENPPYFKTNYNAINVTGTYNTMGQHGLDAQRIDCYGVGDCLIGSQFIVSSGGLRDEADEGAHPFDLQIQEDSIVFEGTCDVGCTTGSTVITVAPTTGTGTQGEGRYLIDKNPAKVITTGLLTSGTGGLNEAPGAGATFSGTNFPVSVFLATAETILSQANNIAPGTVTVPIATSGVTAGFATNTAAVPNPSGVACVADETYSTLPHNYEMANYAVVDGTHLQMTLNKTHRAGATIAFGGLCGYGLEQTVDTVGQIRQVFPVIGSYSPTGLYYGGGLTAIVGTMGETSAFLNMTLPIAAIARTNNVVTVTLAGPMPADVNGLTMNISGVADQSYNGSFTVTSTALNTLTYPEAGADSTSTGGTVAKLTGGYVLYPMAEVLGVFNATTKSVDGQLTLAANTVPWAANDAVEEPHYYQESISGDTTFIGQTTPRTGVGVTAGVQYQENVGPGVAGWTVSNSVPATNYIGNGGTHFPPHAAYEEVGVWQRTMEMQAGEQSVFTINCNSRGCGRWDSNYNLFELQNNAGGADIVGFQPMTSTLQFDMRGTPYEFSPQAFTAGTINAGTVNATTLNGAVNAAQLPLFGGSGSGHGPGAVPDPGPAAGSTRYLREDGTWTVPVSGGSSELSVEAGPSRTAPVVGATADYNFLQGSGAALTDISGNGNDGTLGTRTLAPVWTSTGLAFTGQQQVVLPSTLNSSDTACFSAYINPIGSGTQPTNALPLFVSASNGSSGLNLLYQGFGFGVNAVSNAYALGILAGGSLTTLTQNTVSGYHVYCYVLGVSGTTTDRFFIDGTEVAYGQIGASAGRQTSGNLFLGSSNVSPFTTSGFLGTMYRAVFLSAQATPTQIQQISSQLRADAVARGVLPVPKPIAAATLHAIGDSITAGAGLTDPPAQNWAANLSLTDQPSYTVENWGIDGITTTAVSGSEPNRVGLQCVTSSGPAVAIVFMGTNTFLYPGDLSTTIYTGQLVMNEIASEVQTLRQAGCRVFVGTVLSRGGTDGVGGSLDADKDALDAVILAQAKTVGADGVVDFAANPLLGADGAYANPNPTACSGGGAFQSDGVNPTVCGQLLLAAAASHSLNYYFGSRASSPTLVTASTHTIASGEGYITANPGANQTLTLPDCTGPSGETYTVANIQSAFTVGVVTGSSSQLINGLSSGTAVLVPSNGSVVFRDVPNPKSVSGCHWEK
jgi:trimeric autotransporter adhesin